MTLARTAELVGDAVARGGAVPAFNVITLEHAEAIVLGASRAGVGVILQISENAILYRGAAQPIVAACRELAKGAEVPVSLHYDHLEDEALVRFAHAYATIWDVSSMMVDASNEPYDENVAAMAHWAHWAHNSKMWIEGELGAIGGKDGAHAPGVRTDPDEAAAYVAATGIDGLAVAVGSSHAMLDRSADLDVALIERLAAAVPVPLVLHGSSGVSDDGIRAAVAAGIRKVNVGTALNIAGASALRAALAAQPDAVDPRRYGEASRVAMTDAVAHLAGVIAG